MSTCFLHPRELCCPSSVVPQGGQGRGRGGKGLRQCDTANCPPEIEWLQQNNKTCLIAQLPQLCPECLVKHLLWARHLHTRSSRSHSPLSTTLEGKSIKVNEAQSYLAKSHRPVSGCARV